MFLSISPALFPFYELTAAKEEIEKLKAAKEDMHLRFKGSEIEVTRWDDWQLEYKIIKPVSSSLVLTRF